MYASNLIPLSDLYRARLDLISVLLDDCLQCRDLLVDDDFWSLPITRWGSDYSGDRQLDLLFGVRVDARAYDLSLQDVSDAGTYLGRHGCV